MFAIVCFSASVSASSRYCADSAWARITASEWPTTSCTSRASRACSSRSRAISWACVALAPRRVILRPSCETRAAPAAEPQRQPGQPGHGHSATSTIAGGATCQVAAARTPRRARLRSRPASSALYEAASGAARATAIAAPSGIESAAEPDDRRAAPAGARRTRPRRTRSSTTSSRRRRSSTWQRADHPGQRQRDARAARRDRPTATRERRARPDHGRRPSSAEVGVAVDLDAARGAARRRGPAAHRRPAASRRSVQRRARAAIAPCARSPGRRGRAGRAGRRRRSRRPRTSAAPASAR